MLKGEHSLGSVHCIPDHDYCPWLTDELESCPLEHMSHPLKLLSHLCHPENNHLFIFKRR